MKKTTNITILNLVHNTEKVEFLNLYKIREENKKIKKIIINLYK